jgi:hypothetical protein
MPEYRAARWCLKCALKGKQLAVAFRMRMPHDGAMPSDHASLLALRELIADTDLRLAMA